MRETQSIPLPVPKNDEQAPLSRIEAETRLLARSALVGLAAEGHYMHMSVRHYTFTAIGIPNESMAHYSWDLVDSGRFMYTPSHGLEPSAGAFPESQFEHQVRSMLVQPAITHFESLQAISERARNVLKAQASNLVAAQLAGQRRPAGAHRAKK